jgi:signal transduction histidine kinase
VLRLARACKTKFTQWNEIVPLPIVLMYCLSGILGVLLVLLLKPQESLSRFFLSLALFLVSLVLELALSRKILSQWADTKKNSGSKAPRPAFETLELPDRMLIFDSEGRYQMVIGRPSLAETHPFLNVEGHLLHEVFEKEFADFCLNIIQSTLAKNHAQIVEYAHQSEGINYSFEAHVAPFLDPSTGKRYVVWISRDIRQRKKVEASLLESEKRLRAFVQALPDRVVILDTEGKYHDVLDSQYDSTSFANYGGVEGQNIYDVFDKQVGDFFIAKVRETLEKQENLVFEYEFKYETEIYQLEGRTVPYTDPLSFQPLVIWMARDITASKETLKSLEDSEELLRNIIGVLPDSTNIFDSKGVYLSVLQSGLENAGAATSLLADRIGHSIHDYYPKKFADFCLEMLKKTVAENTMQIFEYAYPPESDTEFFEGRTIPFINPRTGEINILWISRDISVRKQLEKQALNLALQEEKLEFFKQFVDNLTHDLKTPLSIIKTNLYLLQKSKEESQRGQRVTAIDSQVALLRQMIDDMLTISRLDSFSDFTYVTIDLNSILATIISSLRPNAEKKFQNLEFISHLNTAKIYGVDSDLRRAFTNLIENAVNYTPNEGVIGISLKSTDSDYLITIQDSGIGIKQEELPHIFERFYRSEKARFTASGTGLGLAIAARIIDLHHGTIHVESIENQGSKFTIRLPISKRNGKALS